MKMHLLLAFALTIQTTFATSFYIRPFSEFTQTTSNIVRGKISNIHAENSSTPDGGKSIYTYANLEIKEVIKGAITGSQIQIRKLGGTKDGMTLEIPSQVEFHEKEEGVFFLGDEQDDHSYEVSSLELGKFSLQEKNGEEILTGGIFAYSQPDPDHDSNLHSGNLSENLKPWSITQLKELVESQKKSGPTHTITNNNNEISATPTPSSQNPSDLVQTNSPTSVTHSEEKKNSPLYFGSSVWYSLATIVLTLSVLMYLRRG